MRRTRATARVAEALLADPAGRHYGYDLIRQSGVHSGTLYPIVWRMVGAGWLTRSQEDPAQVKGSRPPRVYYQVTDQGREALAAIARDALIAQWEKARKPDDKEQIRQRLARVADADQH